MAGRKLTTNAVIQALRCGGAPSVVRTQTKAMGHTYAFAHTLALIPSAVGERLVSKNILIPSNAAAPFPGASVFVLSQEWR